MPLNWFRVPVVIWAVLLFTACGYRLAGVQQHAMGTCFKLIEIEMGNRNGAIDQIMRTSLSSAMAEIPSRCRAHDTVVPVRIVGMHLGSSISGYDANIAPAHRLDVLTVNWRAGDVVTWNTQVKSAISRNNSLSETSDEQLQMQAIRESARQNVDQFLIQFAAWKGDWYAADVS